MKDKEIFNDEFFKQFKTGQELDSLQSTTPTQSPTKIITTESFAKSTSKFVDSTFLLF